MCLLSVQSLFDELSSAESSPARLQCVRSIKNKLIGSSLNKRLVVALELDLLLLSLLASLTDDDCSGDDELRLQLLTALSSLCCGFREAADRLLQHEMMQLLITAMRSGRRQMLEAALRALRQLLASASDSRRDEAAQAVFAHVDVVAGLVQAVRHWQSPLSELAADVVVHLCAATSAHRLCLLQHGLLPALLSALSVSKPLSSSSPPSSRFLCSLRILAALSQQNLSLGAFLAFCCSIPPAAAPALRAFHPLAVPAASVLPLCSSALLLHAEPAVKLAASSLLLSCVLSVHRLQRRERGEEDKQQSMDVRLLRAELEEAKASELLRLHRDYHASPIGKRGRGGSDKSASRRQRSAAAAAATGGGSEQQHGELFAVDAWIAATLCTLETATEEAGAALSACFGFLSSALPRALRVMVKLVESGDAETLLPACCRLTEAAQDNVELHEEISEALPVVLTLLSGMAGTGDGAVCPPSPPLSFSPLLPPALLRLLAVLASSQEPCRLLVLLEPSHCSVLQSCLSPSSPAALLVPALETVAGLACSYRFHLSVFARSQSAAFVSCLLSLLPHANAAVSTACTVAITALLVQHTAMRPALLQAADTAEALLRSLSVYARCQNGQRRRQEYAVRAMSSIAYRSSASLHQAVLDGLGGWAGTLSLLETKDEREETDELQAAVLSLIRRLLSPSRAERVEDWTQPPLDDKKEQDELQAEQPRSLPAAQLGDVVAAISPLFSAFVSASSSAAYSASMPPESLLCLLLTVSALAECRSSLLLSNVECLSFLLCSLRSAVTVRREMSAATLSNALLLLNAETMTEGKRQQASGARRVTAGRQREESSNGLRRKGSKRRRSVARWEGRAAGERRRTRRRAESEQANGQAVVKHDADDSETKDEEAAVDDSGKDGDRAGGLTSCLTRLSTVGIVAELLSMSRQEEDDAVQSRVRETLFLLRKLARSVTASPSSCSSTAASSASSPASPLLQQLSSLSDRDVDPTDKQRVEAVDAQSAAADCDSLRRSPQPSSSRRELGRWLPWTMDPLLWPSSALPFLLDDARDGRADDSAAGRAEEVEEADDSGEDDAEGMDSETEAARAGGAAVQDSDDDDDDDEELDSSFSFASAARDSLHSLHSLSSRFDHILFRMGPAAASSAISSGGSRPSAQQQSQSGGSGRAAHAASDSLTASSSPSLYPRSALLSSSRHPSTAAGNRELVALMRRGRHMRAIAEAMGVAASSSADRSSSDSQGDDDSMQS